ncbi:Sucrose phosphorylase [Minicystis rosea]|nr:Sucrose phosphorylase [Minicystis rosea]
MILLEIPARVGHHDLAALADAHIDRAAALGFDWIWLMGLWRIGPEAVRLSRTFAPDFEGSPYAIADYEVSPELGGEAALRAFVSRAHARGISVMADFVPNHMSLDSPLVSAHPEYAIHWNPSVRDASPSDYFDHPGGRLAHGKDPYFPGWSDTVQLDYSHPGLRAHQVSVLERIAGLVDGVRCDMAMLVLREHVKGHWFPRVDQGAFDRAYPEEFWSTAIRAVKAKRPDFTFMAEVYWDKEPRLQGLGFDFTYDKKLYDLLADGRAAEDIAAHLAGLPSEYVKRSVHFLENHDEERAAVRFGRRTRPAAILSYALPGAVFVHQGQMEGFTEKLPVQRWEPTRRETVDADLSRFHARLLAVVRDPVFRQGTLEVLGAQQGLVLLVRRHEGKVALVGADPRAERRESPPIEVLLERLGIAAGARVIDRWTGDPIDGVEIAEGRLRLRAGAVASFAEGHGFLLDLG